MNVGIVVFRDGDFDVRFPAGICELKALTGSTWDARIKSVEKLIRSTFDPTTTVEVDEMLRRIELVDPIIAPVGLGTINASSTSDYERSIDEILSSLVQLPRQRRSEGQSRINTEIAKIFHQKKALAKPNASIAGKMIVRDLAVEPKEGLKADFALKNGKLHIASTLDLRKANAPLAEAALKSIVLDKSVEIFGRRQVRTIGVYAVSSEMRSHFKQHIELLGDYAEEIYNWADDKQHKKFLRTMYDALPADFFGGKHSQSN